MTPAAFALFVDAWVLAVGACVGSFLNVVIARVPKGGSIVSPPSSCPRCGKRIAWYDNIPVLSWLLLRARCRGCGLPISARYPLVEVLGALLVFAVWKQLGPQASTLGFAAFVCALLALTFIDLDTWLLPHQITWPLLALGLISPLWNAELSWMEAGVGALAGFGVFAAVALVGEKVLHKETMGWGDVWLLAAIGAWLGWPALLPVVLLSAIQGSVVGIVLLLLGRGPAEKERAERERLAQEMAAAQPAPPPATEPDATAATEPGAMAATEPGATAATELASTESAAQLDADDDWVPPPHALPYGPFLALAALENLLAHDAIVKLFYAVFGKLAP